MWERIQAQKSAQAGFHCHFLPYFTTYVVGGKKRVEVKETAQRLQDVLLHLSSDAGEWLTQNIWWSETIMFFFLSHISSPKYQTFKLWNMAKGNILKLSEFKERIRKPSISLKLIIVQKNSRDKNVPAHLWKLCCKKANSIIQMTGKSPAQSTFFDMDPILNLVTWLLVFLFLIKKRPWIVNHARRNSHQH